MKRNSKNNKDIIDRIELSRDITRFLKDDQYFVTLKILSSRSARSTDKPKDPPFTADHITSNMDPDITTQSNLLNADSKYILGPNAYILMNISIIKSPKKMYSA